jgi:hypothetical protein
VSFDTVFTTSSPPITTAPGGRPIGSKVAEPAAFRFVSAPAVLSMASLTVQLNSCTSGYWAERFFFRVAMTGSFQGGSRASRARHRRALAHYWAT